MFNKKVHTYFVILSVVFITTLIYIVIQKKQQSDFEIYVEAQKGLEADEKIKYLENLESRVGKVRMDSLLVILLSERKELETFYVAGYYTRKKQKEYLYPILHSGCNYFYSLPDSTKWKVGTPFSQRNYSKKSFIKFLNPCE